jgi:L-fuconolactonase
LNMIIDSHQHFWKYNTQDYTWLDESMSSIRKDFLPEDIEPLLLANGIDGCVCIQVNQTTEETQFLHDLAQKNEFIKGLVGWVDLKSKSIEEELTAYKKLGKLKGFRHIVQAEPIGFMQNSDFIKGIKKLADFDFTYDILIYPSQMKDAIHLAKNCPENRLVIDHLAKPNVRGKEISQWGNYLQKLSEFPNVYCKISGMVTEADWKNWEKEDFFIYLDHVLGSFGVNRILYGSDWPVCLVAAEYDEQLDIVKAYFDKLSETEKSLIFGLNAAKFYKL